jgi:hypothetical protein
MRYPIIFLGALFLVLGSCKGPEPRKPVQQKSGSFFKESIERNRKLLAEEENMIQEIIQFISDNKTKMRELSLRTVIKCADLVKSFPDKWKEMANITLNAR